MIVSLFLTEHDYLIDQPQTFNFGGRNIYSFEQSEGITIVRKKQNPKYIPNFFNISRSACNVELLSAIVGQNGIGKSSVLDVIRSIFVENQYSLPQHNSVVLIEDKGQTKVLSSNNEVYLAVDEDEKNGDYNTVLDFKVAQITDDGELAPKGFQRLEEVDRSTYQSLYYSPHYDLKYSFNFSDVDRYDISLDQYLKQDLESTDNRGSSESGIKFGLHEELLFINSVRQIEFLNSDIYVNNEVFREVFNLPYYRMGILHFRDAGIPEFHNTPNRLRPIIELILAKAKSESAEWHVFRDANSTLEKSHRQALVSRYLLERYVIKAFLSAVVQQMEKSNTWLEEGKIDDPYNMDRFSTYTSHEVLVYFIKESYIEMTGDRWQIFNEKEIIPFFDKLQVLFEQETNPDNVSKQSIRVAFGALKEILVLHKNILVNLLQYYPKKEGLIEKGDYAAGFISFRPTDRNLSSGENALLNFFSKLYDFIDNNLIERSKSLPDREHYILLLDEADLGFHPIWKKRYVSALLRALPYFFEKLELVPKLQIVISTHDPLTLSDLPNSNVVFLRRDNGYSSVIRETEKDKIQKTFGANITDLLSHSFFVEDGLIGDFAKAKIKEVINWINEHKNSGDKYKSTPEFERDLHYYKKVVGLIDEKIVKMKLTEMLTDLVPDDEYFNTVIDKEIEFLRNKKR